MAQNFGLNPDLNKYLAKTTGYTGDFGGGEWQKWINSESPQLQAIAQRAGQSWADPMKTLTGTQNFGANPDLNQAVAGATGYTGDFGGGQWQKWINAQSPEQQTTAQNAAAAYQTSLGPLGTPLNPAPGLNQAQLGAYNANPSAAPTMADWATRTPVASAPAITGPGASQTAPWTAGGTGIPGAPSMGIPGLESVINAGPSNRWNVLDTRGNVANTILADEAFMAKNYPGMYRPEQTFGMNTGVNREQALATGYTGNFGGGEWQKWIDQQSPEQKATAQLATSNYVDPAQNFGLNPVTNRQLVGATGYTGDFGTGNWQRWLDQQPASTQGKIANIKPNDAASASRVWAKPEGGRAPEANQWLAGRTGYAGDFGSGGFEGYLAANPQYGSLGSMLAVAPPWTAGTRLV